MSARRVTVRDGCFAPSACAAFASRADSSSSRTCSRTTAIMRSATFRSRRWRQGLAVSRVALAEPRRHAAALLGPHDPCVARAVGALRAAALPLQGRAKAIQLVFGLSIPLLLGRARRGPAHRARVSTGSRRGYAQALHTFWVASPDAGRAAGRRAGRRLDPRLHRPLLLAAPEALLPAGGADPARGGGTAADAGAPRLLPERTRGRSAERDAGMAGRQPFPGSDRHARAERRPCRDSRQLPVCVGGRDRSGSLRARRSRDRRASPWPRPHLLSRRPDRSRSAWA